MKYMGSKARHAKELLPIILKDHKPEMWYVEPFVGGANMIDKVPKEFKRFGADVHEYLIAMWQAVSEGWTPPENITEEFYNEVKNNKENYPKELVGYVGFPLSYSGKWFGGWCRDRLGKQNYVAEAYRNAEKQFPNLLGVRFINKSYSELVLPKKCTIYCDPPYKDTTKYSSSFDHDKFYDWCREKHKGGHVVFISEYQMPEDFICVWAKEVKSSLTKEGGKRGVERLFTLI